MQKGRALFITGIDLGLGKTYATGLLAKALMQQGKTVITQKLIPTGCSDFATDIVKHRELQGIPLMDDDKSGLTCPYTFSYLASPLMASGWEGQTIDPDLLTKSTDELLESYDYVLIESNGGLMVPLTPDLLNIDYVKQHGYPVLIVTSGKMGSVNQTLLSVNACQMYGLDIKALVYNLYSSADVVIEANSLAYFRGRYPDIPMILLHNVQQASYKSPSVDVLL